MKIYSFLLVTAVLFSCNHAQPNEATSEAAAQDPILDEPIQENTEIVSEETEIDTISLILEEWHRDFRMFNNIGTVRPDSITPVNFSGKYKLETEGYNFSLALNQTGISLRGNYCGYTDEKSDCGMSSQGVNDPLVKGKVLGDTAHLYYYSNYANKFGRAKIYFQNDTLIWKATQTPDALFIGTPYESKLKFIGDKQEDSEVWPEPRGC